MSRVLCKNLLTGTILLLLWIFTKVNDAQHKDLCNNAQSSCDECIRAHPRCAWCADVQQINEEAPQRCKSLDDHPSCGAIENPQSTEMKTKNLDISTNTSTGPINLKPQASTVKLRIGEPIKINVTFKKLVDYPLDLYYLLDLSSSMRDDLELLQKLSINLANDIRENVTENVNLGFGTFVDKVLLPYATDQESFFERICEGICQKTFGFRHQLSITESETLFQESVADTVISANVDPPEGGLDALMQIAVCTDIIGWRQNALHVVLFSSDASSHVALDGKLAGLFDINDMQCHLEKEALNSSSYIYSKSSLLDYPSIGQLREVFRKNNIDVIFAVTQASYKFYKDLNKTLPATIAIQQLNSNNIFEIIAESYNKIKSQFRMETPSPPENVDLFYSVLCPGASSFKQNSLDCNNVDINDTVVYQLEFNAKSCPVNPDQADELSLSFSAIAEQIQLRIEYLCDCKCSSGFAYGTMHGVWPTIAFGGGIAVRPTFSFGSGHEEWSTGVFGSGHEQLLTDSQCSGYGQLQCGVCNCIPGWSGELCHCESNLTTAELRQQCVDDNGAVCNDKGNCSCGKCQNCVEGYYGDFCECRRTGCREDGQNMECGGIEKGECANCYGNSTCKCNTDQGWYLNHNTEICECNDILCKKNGSELNVCSGIGKCDCKTCVCNENNIWTGTFCDTCIHPSCTAHQETCEERVFRVCADCAYSRVATEDCAAYCQDLDIQFLRLETLPNCRQCITNPQPGCQFCDQLNLNALNPVACSFEGEVDQCEKSYIIGWNKNPPGYLLFVQQANYELDCPQPVDPLLIVLPVSGGVMLIGILGLVAWRLITNHRDKIRFKAFLDDVKSSKWAAVESKIYVGASTRFENPNYISDNNT